METRAQRAQALRDCVQRLLEEMGDGDHALWERYPSALSLLDARDYDPERDRISSDSALLLKLMGDLAGYRAREVYSARPTLLRLKAAADYLRSFYIGASVEQFCLLSLNANGRVLSCTPMQRGTVDETPFYISAVLQSVAQNGAHAVVFCHNHPGGTLQPSQADLKCTLDGIKALNPLGVVLLDHIIIAGSACVSIRAEGYLDPALWIAQAPKDKLLNAWLNPN